MRHPCRMRSRGGRRARIGRDGRWARFSSKPLTNSVGDLRSPRGIPTSPAQRTHGTSLSRGWRHRARQPIHGAKIGRQLTPRKAPMQQRAGDADATRCRCQLRPAITPPSTSHTAPVTQAALSDSRNAITSATSCAVPTRPMGWNPLKPCSAACTSAFGMNPS